MTLLKIPAVSGSVHPGLLTIFSTGHGDQRIVDALSAPPNVRVLAKRWDFDMLTACLTGLLRDTADITDGWGHTSNL